MAPNRTKMRPANRSFWFFTEMRIGILRPFTPLRYAQGEREGPRRRSVRGDVPFPYDGPPPLRLGPHVTGELLRRLARRDEAAPGGQPLRDVRSRHHLLHGGE